MNALPSSPSFDVDESWVVVDETNSPALNIAPENAVLRSQITRLSDQALASSSHKVLKMSYCDERRVVHAVYFKECDPTYPPILAQIEAAASASCRLIRGNNAAKVLPVVSEFGAVIGTISFELPEFRPFSACTLTVDDLIRCNVAESWVMRYVEEDDDYHTENGGLIKKDACGDLDFDMFYYPITSEIKGPRFINNGFFAPHPADAFPCTISDLEEFPNIKDQRPCYWPTKRPSNNNLLRDWQQRFLFQSVLPSHKGFETQKWVAFIKKAMICNEMYETAIAPSFGKDLEGQNMYQRLAAHMNKRHDDLAMLLPHSPKFRYFLSRNRGIFPIIEQTFRENFPLYEHVQPIVKQRFFNLVRTCMVKDLTAVLMDIGVLTQSDRSKRGPYYRLVSVVQQFHEDPSPFDQALNQLDIGVQSLTSSFSPELDKPLSEHFAKFVSFINNYRGFSVYHANVMESMYMRSQEIPLNMPIESIDAAKVIAKEICQWLSSREHMMNVLTMVKECVSEYVPSLGSWNPRSYFRQRGSALETLAQEVEFNMQHPNKVINAILEFLQEGAWNQPGLMAGASANVLLIKKLAKAALKDFTSMLYPALLFNHDLVQVCFLIKNNKWKLIEHVQEIAAEMKVIHTRNLRV